MGGSEPLAGAVQTRRDHGFHRLRVSRVVRETAEASSFVLDVPRDLRETFAYRSGQFCNLRVTIGGRHHVRCYSMSSSPAVDPEPQVTVKRVPGGLVSNWLLDHVAAGHTVEASPPAGFFQLTPSGGELVAYAAGSGITPVFSLLKTALATTDRRARLLYANRDRAGVIFHEALGALRARHGDRLEVVHRLDVVDGLVDAAAVQAFAAGGGRGGGGGGDAHHYLCGPAPFMALVEGALLDRGVRPADLHLERFTPVQAPAAPEAGPAPDATGDCTVTVELAGRSTTTAHRPGTTVLQAARQMGLAPPFSCEAGNCATCMARLVEGAVTMRANNALTPDEVDEGWILTCQAVPSGGTVRVAYDLEGA
ncbi:MAG: 2Fe-2S iron-sulfur cluster-binding protein [Acidimicrobiales bacterium]